MTATEFQDLVDAAITTNSGHEEHRGYIGMSRVGHCPRRTFFEVRDGSPANLAQHTGCWLGYLIEAGLLELLGDHMGPGRELVAFDGRIKGHTDGEISGKLLEIKTTTSGKLAAMMNARRVPDEHFAQVQTYMLYGGYTSALVLYLPRDWGSSWVTEVHAAEWVQRRCERRLARLVLALDANEPPACECGKCLI